MPSKSKLGHPKVTDRADVVSLLVSAFRDGLTVRQACFQSGISHKVFYECCRDDQEFAVLCLVGCHDYCAKNGHKSHPLRRLGTTKNIPTL